MELLEALQLAKGMKRPIIYVTNNYILGSDISFGILSMITLNEPITNLDRPFCAEFNSILMAPEKISKFRNDNPTMFFSYYEKVSDGVYINTFDEFKLTRGITGLQYRCGILMDNSDYIDELQDITHNENFECITKLKTSNGLVMCKGKFGNITHFLSTFVSMHPVTKTDTLNLKLYKVDDRSFLAHFECIKKKNVIINEYIRYRYI